MIKKNRAKPILFTSHLLWRIHFVIRVKHLLSLSSEPNSSKGNEDDNIFISFEIVKKKKNINWNTHLVTAIFYFFFCYLKWFFLQKKIWSLKLVWVCRSYRQSDTGLWLIWTNVANKKLITFNCVFVFNFRVEFLFQKLRGFIHIYRPY